MAGAQQYAVSTTPTLLASAPASSWQGGPAGWFSLNNGGTVPVYLNGGTAVSSTNGYQVSVFGNFSGYLFSGDAIYAVTTAGTSTVSVIQTGA